MHGHFGVKMHRSTRKRLGGEITANARLSAKTRGTGRKRYVGPAYRWSTARIWGLAAGGADEPGVIWCGTLPGGLFRSTDGGGSWEMIRSLWDHPKRKRWSGGGADLPGIHSIVRSIPAISKRVWGCVVSSTGGIWFTDDSGASWSQRGGGMRAEYAPPEFQHDPVAQDVHCLAQCHAVPHRMWVQHHNGIFVSSDEGMTFNEIPM